MRSEVFTALKIQVLTFWVVILCTDAECFGGLCCLNLHGEMSGAWKWTKI